MVRPTSLFSRSIAVLVSASLVATTCAEGASFGFITLKDFVQQFVSTNPGQHTDVPREPYLGENPDRMADTRGGIWSEKALRAIDTGNLLASLGGSYFALPVSVGAGAAFDWEGEAENSDGTTNTANGNKLTTIPVVGWKVRGGMELAAVLYHNSQGALNEEFGKGWTWSYGHRVIEWEDFETGLMNAHVRWHDGRSIPYINNGSGYTAPAGIHDALVKNGGGTWTLTTKKQVKYGFNTSGYLTTVTDRNANTITIARNGSNQPTSVTDPTGRVLTLSISSGRVASFTDPLSRVWSLTYNGSTELTTLTHPVVDGNTYTDAFTYNANWDVLTHTDRRGKVWTFTYNTDGSLASEKTPLNHTTSYSYTSSATTITNPLGKTQVDNYSSGKLASSVDESSFSESYTWNGSRQLTTLTDKRGKDWVYTYDSKSNVLTKKNPLNNTWTYTYNSKNDVLTAKNPLNQQYTVTYDTPGNLLTVTDPLSRVAVTNTYDSNGQLLTTKNALNETTTMAYNSNGHLTSVTDPLSHATSFTVNTLGWVTATTDALSNVESVAYDNWGRPVTYTHPGSVTESVQYNANDQKTAHTNELSKTESFTYDDTGRLTGFTNRRGDSETYAYNSANRRTSVTNGRGKTRTYTYSDRGEVVTLTMPDSAYEQWSYDGNGNVSAYTSPLNQTISYTYDNASRHTAVDYPAGTDTSFGYDTADRRTSMVDSIGTTSWTYNAAGENTALNTPQGNMTYTYSSAGRRATMVETSLGTTTYSYDSAGRLTSLANRFSETTAFTYDNANRLTKKTFSTGQYTDYGYDSRHRTTSVSHKKSDNSTISSESYSWNSASNLTSKTVDSLTTTFTYDDSDQLLTEARTGYSASYTYDSNGNRATKVLGGVTDTYTNDDGDKLTQIVRGGVTIKSFGYDAAGRTTSVVTSAGTATLTYDYESRVTGITYPGSSTNSFTYNGLDTRVGKTDSAGSTTYKRDGAYVTDPVLTDSSAAFTPGISERRSGASKFYGSDYLGTNSLITNSSQATTDTKQYDAFGLLVSSSGSTPTPFGFAGGWGYQEDADSGLKLLGHRYYDASTGRFLSRDRAKDGHNWFIYGVNNPNSRVDPQGLGIIVVIAVGLALWGLYELADSATNLIDEGRDNADAMDQAFGSLDDGKYMRGRKKQQVLIDDVAELTEEQFEGQYGAIPMGLKIRGVRSRPIGSATGSAPVSDSTGEARMPYVEYPTNVRYIID